MTGNDTSAPDDGTADGGKVHAATGGGNGGSPGGGPGGGVITARAVRRRLRRARSAHRETSIGAILTDVYMVGLALAIYGALAVTAIRRHLRLPSAGSPAESSVRGWLLVAVVLVLGGLAWHAARDLGPVYVTAAARYWAAGAPVDRAAWLRPALGWVTAVGAACGALFGTLVVLIGGADPILIVATTLAGAALPPAAVVAQAKGVAHARRVAGAEGVGRAADKARGEKVVRGERVARAEDVAPGGGQGRAVGAGRAKGVSGLVGLGVGLAVFVVGVDSLGYSLPAPALPGVVLACLAGIGAAFAVGLGLGRLGRLDAAALSGGAQLADAATVSLVLLQPAMFSDIIEIRRWRRVGLVRSRRHPGPAPAFLAHRETLRRGWGLVRADLVRQGRRRAGLLAFAGLAVVPYAMTLVAPGGTAPARVIAGFLAAERLCAGLRALCRSAALRRLLGGTDLALTISHLVVPGIGLALWWTATLPASPGPWPLEPLLACGILGAAYRAASRRPTRYDGPAVDTPFGIVQPDLVTQIVRGPDLAASVALLAFTLG